VVNDGMIDLYDNFQVNVALKYFEARDPWEKLLRSDQTAAKQMYWIIAGERNFRQDRSYFFH
jgi:hypothetical protein